MNRSWSGTIRSLGNVWIFLWFVHSLSTVNAETRDVIVYGATPAGIIAAIQLKDLGHDVLLIEPSSHLGGMTTGGLGATDIGNKQAIGGLAREFYERVFRHYERAESWKFQPRSAYRGPHQQPGEKSQWTFEPRVAQSIFQDWLESKKVEVRFQVLLDRERPTEKKDGRIVRIPLVDQDSIAARYFVDATYEGDLMATAKVSYVIGRESNAKYSETLNGAQFSQAIKHQFFPGVSPYIVPGDAASGLLPGLSMQKAQPDGTEDRRVQAYCLRMTLTDAVENQIPFSKPDNYDEQQFELLFRNFQAGLKQLPWHSIAVPNRKTDTNNNTGFSTDYIGMSDLWPEASYEQRKRLFAQHLSYQKGLCWTLANHPRIPEAVRNEAKRWGLSRDEFMDHQGWSPQLYIREARRMVGQSVMTEHHCRGKQTVLDSIGMAAYTMDSHNVQRIVGEKGDVQNEGDVQVGGFPPYPLSLGCIIPKKEECTNLAVPVCLSATHIAYGSIRMEPVFMVLGQSAADAIHLAMRNDTAIQNVDYSELRNLLQSQKQVFSGLP